MEKCQADSERLQEDKGFTLNTQIEFSVVMPFHNATEYVKSALESVLNQSCHDWEIVAVDDGSTDDTLRILREFETRCSKIRVFQHDGALNKGVSASRNLAISKSKGNWIALLDADDIWYPEKLKRESQIINSFPDVVLIYSKAKRINEIPDNDLPDNSIYGSGEEGEKKDAFRKLLPGFFTSTSAVTFKKDSFLKCGGFNENMRFAEDTLLFHQIMEHGNVYCIDEILGAHRIHKSSTVAKAPREQRITSRFIVYEQLISKVKKENKPLVSATLVNTGLLKILRNYILYPYNKPQLAFQFLIRTIKNPDVFIRHKIKAIILFFSECAFSPFKTLWLKIRSK